MPHSLTPFDFRNLKGDMLGGITAGIVGLPLCIALGAASGLGPVAGLYCGIILGLVAAVMGGCNTQISAPTGPMTSVIFIAVIPVAIEVAGSVQAGLSIVVATLLLASVIELLLGIFKLGKYVAYIPFPVLSGFMSGIGVIVILLSLKDFLGVDLHGEKYNAVQTMTHLHEWFGNRTNWTSAALAFGTTLLILVFPKVTKAVPATLVALVAGTAVSYFLKLPETSNVKIVGFIPTEMPTFQLGTLTHFPFEHFPKIIVAALSLGALGAIDTLLTSVVADKMTRTRHKSNRELIGQGLGNMASALFGGSMGAGTTVVTVTNIKSGGRTKWSGVFQALFLILIVAFGSSIAEQIPYPVLGGILLTIGIKIIDVNTFSHFGKVPWRDSFITVVVLVLTISWGLIEAVAVGMVLSMAFFMKRMADVINYYSHGSKVEGISEKLISSFKDAKEFKEQIYIKALKGPIFFGFASRFEESIASIPKKVKAIILNMEAVPYMDQSGMYALTEAIAVMKEKDIIVCLAGCNEENEKWLRKIKTIPDVVDEDRVYQKVEEAVLWLHDSGALTNEGSAKYNIIVPSAFTPDGDGVNDELIIRGLSKFPHHRVRILTENGEEVFHSGNYKESPFDGLKDGKNLPQGRYKIEIFLSDEKENLNGDFHLLRN